MCCTGEEGPCTHCDEVDDWLCAADLLMTGCASRPVDDGHREQESLKELYDVGRGKIMKSFKLINNSIN